jgi:hypothetical protein
MSDSDPTTSTTIPEIDQPTQEIFVAGGDDGLGRPTEPGGPGELPSETMGDDEWPVRGPRQGVRMSVPTVVLFGLLIAAGGIWGGAALQRSHGTSSNSTASSLASLFGGRSSTTGRGSLFSGAAAAGGATTGTVTEVSGTTLYVTNASGDLVKVTVGPSATVNRNAKSSLESLQVGDTVVVEGTKASNGSVTATSVSATAAGVTSGFAGFGGTGG